MKQPGDALMGFGIVISLFALLGAAANGPAAGTSPILMLLVGLVLLVLGYLRRRTHLR